MLHVNIPSKAGYAWTADATENCQSGDDLDAYVNLSSFFLQPQGFMGFKAKQANKRSVLCTSLL